MGGDVGIDDHIGQRLRGLRVARGLSQADVAVKVDLSFQQIQKYESGKSRVTAAKLCELAQALEIPVSFSSKIGRRRAMRAAPCPMA